jgi:hypothetical protein
LNNGQEWEKWSRKRKVEECAAKSTKERKDYHGGAKDGYNVIKMSNAKFKKYYSYIGLHDSWYDADNGQFVPCASNAEKHAEQDLFMSMLSEVLPASFRVDRSLDPMIQWTLLDKLQHFIGKEMKLEIKLPRTSAPTAGRKEILERADASDSKYDPKLNGSADAKSEDCDGDGEKEANDKDAGTTDNGPIFVRRTIAPAKPIPFISSNDTILGFQLAINKWALRCNKSMETFHTWLKIQTDCGHITHQETVCMIPPVVLNAKEGMSILDMCAAPGSKTCQLLEIVGGLQQDQVGKTLEPTGYVVANDADPKRAYMLVMQLGRMNSPSAFVTSCDGQFFPILDDKSVRGTEREGLFD